MRKLFVLVLMVSLIAACSSSGGSNSDSDQRPVEEGTDSAIDTVAADIEEGNETENPTAAPVDNDNALEDEASSTNGQSESVPPSTVSDEVDEEEVNPVVVDPMIQNQLLVTFDITVPAYQSDALRVELSWGDMNFTANWVGDEYWTASAEFPTSTEHTLIVIFYDNNGALELADFSEQYETGTNSAESFQIDADQFDTDPWDDDGDGVSNIDELIAGTDPTVDEAALLPIRDRVDSFGQNRIREALSAMSQVSRSYETSITGPFPIFEDIENPETPDCLSGRLGAPIARTIDIDESGTGSFSQDYRCTAFNDNTTQQEAGTRSVVDGAVLWSGTYRRNNSSAAVGDSLNFSTETTYNDDQIYTQTGMIGRAFQQSYAAIQTISYNVTASINEESGRCELASGIIDVEHETTSVTAITISKKVSDTYWRFHVAEEGLADDEYLVQSLGITFSCGFAD